LGIPFVYFGGKKSSKIAASIVALIAILNIALVLTTVPTILNSAEHMYIEEYAWIPVLNSNFTLFVDGISVSIAIIAMVLMVAAALFSIKYMEGKKNLPVYYVLLSLLSVGLVGVFLTSNLLLFYFCWELMLLPAYFIIGSWGYRESYRAAFKFFIFTHAGAVFVLLGIGAIYMVTGATDLFAAQTALLAFPDLAKWIIIALTAGFAVKMAIVPLHMWLPDAHSEAPATMSALLSGVIISAGAYAILRLSLGAVFPAVAGTEFGVSFLHGLAVFGVISAFFGSFIALVENDIKRIIAYSSIAHMGYILFGLSLYPSEPLIGGALAITTAITGTVFHILTHAVSNGLLFLSAGAVMHQTELRDIREMGGLAGKMPFTSTSAIIASLSIAGSPPFACFISEFLIFVGAFDIIRTNSFYLIPTILMLIATVFSLAYSLRFVYRIFISPPKPGTTLDGNEKHKITDIPNSMKLSLLILIIFVVLLGVYPAFFINLINTVGFI
jgi:NADH-quinone oxidoreductase subunit M